MKNLQMIDNIEVFLYKKTKDNDLKKGQLVCYQNLYGTYAHLGTITDIIIVDNTKNYLIDSSMGAYTATELKLTNKN
jgi:hypothetical protein